MDSEGKVQLYYEQQHQSFGGEIRALWSDKYSNSVPLIVPSFEIQPGLYKVLNNKVFSSMAEMQKVDLC